MDISKTRAVIATHFLVYGAPQALREYFLTNGIKELFVISHPLKIDGSRSSIEICDNKKTCRTETAYMRSKFNLLNYILEPTLSLYWFIKFIRKSDLYVGVDPLNCLLGVLLKRMRAIDKLIYYTIDYVPQRFSNKLLNRIYHKVDEICLSNSDETWNVSPRIAEGRERYGRLSVKRYKNQKVVPIGVWMNRVRRLPYEKIKKHQLLFVGNLLEKQGVQIVLEAIPDIVKQIPDFHFLIVGGGDYESTLRDKVERLKIKKYVTFTGWIKDRSKLDEIMADSALAIAMYDRDKDTFTYYADPTKLKDYLSAGLPILLTDVPFNAHDIEKHKCGVIIEYNKKTIVKSITSMLSNEKRLIQYRDNAIQYISEYDWGSIFSEAIKTI